MRNRNRGGDQVNTLFAPALKPKRPPKRTREQRIGERITVQADGCWIYGNNPAEYGKMSDAGSAKRTHRFVWETLKGPIPDGCDLHHTCVTPACCNPAHLRALSPREHQRAHREIREARKTA